MGIGVPIGGSLALAELLTQHGAEIEADLQRYFGLDIRDVFAEDTTVTPRRVLALLGTLPTGTAFTAELAGGRQHREWTLERYLQKMSLDLQQYTNYILRAVNGDKRARVPEPVPGPNGKTSTKQSSSTNTFAEMARAGLAQARQLNAS